MAPKGISGMARSFGDWGIDDYAVKKLYHTYTFRQDGAKTEPGRTQEGPRTDPGMEGGWRGNRGGNGEGIGVVEREWRGNGGEMEGKMEREYGEGIEGGVEREWRGKWRGN